LCQNIDEKKTAGKPMNKETELIYNDLKNFYKNTYFDLFYFKKYEYTNLSGIVNYMATEVMKNIINNIKFNFIKNVKNFVNRMMEDELKGVTKIEKKLIRSKINQVKNDLLEGTNE